jgi:broad specificity phosphatase PhoE
MSTGTHQTSHECGTYRTRLVFVRHLASELSGCFCGQSDPPLSAQGRSCIAALADSVRPLPVSAIFCSDLRRTRETAAPIAEQFQLACQTSEELREIYFGRWEGLAWSEVQRHFPDDARAWAKLFPHHSPPGGESFRNFRNRVIGELERLADKNQNACAVVVTHAGFIRSAISWVLKIPDECIARIGQDYGGITILEKALDSWTVPTVNAHGHLLPSIPKVAEGRV